MFILPFLKYLKPHLWRIALSLVCMVFVSLMGAFSIAMMIPALKVMVELHPEVTAEPGEPPPALAAAETPGPPAADAAATEPGGEHHAKAGSPEDKLKEDMTLARRTLESFIPESVRTNAKGFFDTRRDAFRSWYQTEARNNPVKLLYLFCGILLGATAIKGVAEYLSNYHVSHTFYFINLKLQEDVFRNVMMQDYLFFTKHSAGYLASRIGGDSRAINSTLQKILSDGIQQPMNLIAFAILLVYISPRLSLLVTLLLPPMGGLIYYFGRVLRKNTRLQKRKIDEMGSTTSESLFNVRLIKALGTEQDEIDKFVRKRKELFHYFMQRRLVKFASGPIMEIMGMVAASGILITGGYAIFGGGVSWLGKLDAIDFGAFLYTLTKFYRPLKALSKTTMGFQVARVSAERLQEMLALRPVVNEAENPKPFSGLTHGIEFRNVSLKYNKKQILHDVNLEIPAGKVVALVGETGSGKTTIANLVARLFDPTNGQILFDGIDLREYRTADIRAQLGIVTQDTILFDDSVANNIGYGNELEGMGRKDRMDAIIRAAKIANADTFIRALDGGKGYQTEIGPSGCRLSGGQAQRIAIARAVFRDPKILLLDEATSALDSQTQASVQEAMNHALENRTALVISHRLSTIRNADRIYVLENGRIVEWGTFDDLMSRQGLFRKLYQAEALAETA